MKARVIAYYLPQYYPIRENDQMWGKGFTEWTNVAKAKPLFRGHYQPQIPADLGFYDLRLKEVRNEQVKLAKKAGIEGFCYWHYWFGNGKRILERPFEEVLQSGSPDFPFCLGWANHSWSNKTWKKTKAFQKDIVFVKQEYLGNEDYIQHFYSVLPAFMDKRYITVENKPLFLIYAPGDFSDVSNFMKIWDALAKQNGLKGIHFVARLTSVGTMNPKISKKELLNGISKRYDHYIDKGFDAIASSTLKQAELLSKGYYRKMFYLFLEKYNLKLSNERYNYKHIIKNLYTPEDRRIDVYPQLVPRWDKTPRQGKNAEVFCNSTPELFKKSVELALNMVIEKPKEKRILFLFAWNEWGEGAYMEPDIKFGHGYINALREALNES